MFKQITDLSGGEYYLITSLLIFMVFFILIGVYLLKLNKNYIKKMSEMPINEPQPNNDADN